MSSERCCFFVRKYLNDKHQNVSLTRQAESMSETQIIEEKPQCNHFPCTEEVKRATEVKSIGDTRVYKMWSKIRYSTHDVSRPWLSLRSPSFVQNITFPETSKDRSQVLGLKCNIRVRSSGLLLTTTKLLLSIQWHKAVLISGFKCWLEPHQISLLTLIFGAK